MNVSTLEWSITLGVTIAVLLFDVVVIGRRPHEPTTRETAGYLALYIGLAVAFGIWVWQFHGGEYGVEYFAGWLTEYSLSVDNLFIFLIIMAKMKVPRKLQQYALLVGIILALIGAHMALVWFQKHTQFPGPGTIYLGQELKFTKPVRIGDTLTVLATVAEKNDEKKRVKMD